MKLEGYVYQVISKMKFDLAWLKWVPLAVLLWGYWDNSATAQTYVKDVVELRQVVTQVSNTSVQQETALENEADRLLSEGIALYESNEYRLAIDALRTALEIYRNIGDGEGEAVSLANLGVSHLSLSSYREASEFLKEALDVFVDLGDYRSEANVINTLGIVYLRLGDRDRTVKAHQQALEIAIEFDDRNAEANAIGSLGMAYYSLGSYQEASDFLQRHLSLTREIEDRSGEAKALAGLGLVANSIRNYEQAIDFHQQYLSLARKIDDRQLEAEALSYLGTTYYGLGSYRRAIDLLQQSLLISTAIEDREVESSTLSLLGLAYDSLGNYDLSIDFFQRSLSIGQNIASPRAELRALGNLGALYGKRENYEQSIVYMKQALPLVQRVGDRQSESTLLGNMGIAYGRQGNYSKAINLQKEALEIAIKIGDRQNEAYILNNLGDIYMAQERLEDAEDSFVQSVNILESLRSSSLPDSTLISFFDTQEQAYKDLEASLAAQGKFESALETSERGRARAFAQMLSNPQPSELENLALLKSPSFKEIQQIAKEQNSVLIEYSLIENEKISKANERWSLHIWLVQPTGEIHFKDVHIGSDLSEIIDLVSKSRSAMGVTGRGFAPTLDSANSQSVAAELEALHELLVEPIAELLPNDAEQQIVFIPKDELFLVPFPALLDSTGKYLIEKHTISTAPSIQVLGLTRERASANASNMKEVGNVLAVGNPKMPEVWNAESAKREQLPTLPGAEQEAQEIASFFNGEALLGDHATEQAVKAKIEQASIVHLATHGLLEYGSPEESGVVDVPGAIALTPTQDEDGLLTSAEILMLNLQADLVVLSACDTGLGNITGDGVVGLSRSLIAAGTPSVIASLWSVPDTSTAELMTEFYRQRQQGQNKAQSLRQAMLTTMQSHPDPADWAAFTLIGEAN